MAGLPAMGSFGRNPTSRIGLDSRNLRRIGYWHDCAILVTNAKSA
jgi:hypothetical protein